MIKLRKTAVPGALARNAARWTAELLKEIAAGGDKVALRQNKYNHPEIKAALIAETNEKCAYCESLPLHVTHGDIEHITPKSEAPDLTFEWNNLTLACTICNGKKSNKEDLLDPYNDEVRDDLKFVGPMVLHKDGSAKAERTVLELDLNRKDLVARRLDHLMYVNARIRDNNKNPDAHERELTRAALSAFFETPAAAFSACAQDFIALQN